MTEATTQITPLLNAYAGGDPQAGEEIVRIVYPELRRIARRMLGRLRSGETLDTTALVHEAFLKLHEKSAGYQDRVHFLSLCARAMRQILIDHARRRQSQKRGGDAVKISLDAVASSGPGLQVSDDLQRQSETLIALDSSLRRLETIDARLVRVVECRFFAGMTEQEIGDALDMSVATVQRSWVKARAWLQDSLSG